MSDELFLVRQYERECRFLARKSPEIEHQPFMVYDQVEPLRRLYEALSNPIEVWDTHYDELVAFCQSGSNGSTA